MSVPAVLFAYGLYFWLGSAPRFTARRRSTNQVGGTTPSASARGTADNWAGVTMERVDVGRTDDLSADRGRWNKFSCACWRIVGVDARVAHASSDSAAAPHRDDVTATRCRKRSDVNVVLLSSLLQRQLATFWVASVLKAETICDGYE